jgi:hypothetical protein
MIKTVPFKAEGGQTAAVIHPIGGRLAILFASTGFKMHDEGRVSQVIQEVEPKVEPVTYKTGHM